MMNGEEAILEKRIPWAKPSLEDVQDEVFVAQDGAEVAESAQQALAGPAARRKRLPEQHRASEQDDADGQQDDEDAAPPDGIGQYAAEYRSRHRSDAVDDTDDGEDLDQAPCRGNGRWPRNGR